MIDRDKKEGEFRVHHIMADIDRVEYILIVKVMKEKSACRFRGKSSLSEASIGKQPPELGSLKRWIA